MQQPLTLKNAAGISREYYSVHFQLPKDSNNIIKIVKTINSLF